MRPSTEIEATNTAAPSRGYGSDGERRAALAQIGLPQPDDATAEQVMAAVNGYRAAWAAYQRNDINPAKFPAAEVLAMAGPLIKAERRKAAEPLFRRARCPERHTLNLDAIAAAACPAWIAVRDRLHARTKLAGGGLFALLGNRGTGKTQLAVSLVHRCTMDGLACRYAKAADLFREIRSTYARQPYTGDRVETEADVFARFAGYDVLVVDECHQRADTAAEANTLTNLVDRRYDDRLVTVLIANQGKTEFAAGVGDSIVSRIHEDGEAIVCDWPSFRRPDAKRSTADLSPRVSRAERERRAKIARDRIIGAH